MHVGIDADLKKKFQEKYDPAKVAAASKWIESLTKTKITNLQEDLKSGVVLCNLINAVSPGTVKAPNKGTSLRVCHRCCIARLVAVNQPFVHRENIVAYLAGCKKLGMKETDLFVTQDL